MKIKPSETDENKSLKKRLKKLTWIDKSTGRLNFKDIISEKHITKNFENLRCQHAVFIKNKNICFFLSIFFHSLN